jgi:hypothetical protein
VILGVEAIEETFGTSGDVKRYQLGKDPKIFKIFLKKKLTASQANARSHRIATMKIS